jgi:hypothetical protein
MFVRARRGNMKFPWPLFSWLCAIISFSLIWPMVLMGEWKWAAVDALGFVFNYTMYHINRNETGV